MQKSAGQRRQRKRRSLEALASDGASVLATVSLTLYDDHALFSPCRLLEAPPQAGRPGQPEGPPVPRCAE